MKDNNKKEIKYLNVCMDNALHEEFEAFCKAHGMSKVGAAEQAIRQYMDELPLPCESMESGTLLLLIE